jgi:hypothetical protein
MRHPGYVLMLGLLGAGCWRKRQQGGDEKRSHHWVTLCENQSIQLA